MDRTASKQDYESGLPVRLPAIQIGHGFPSDVWQDPGGDEG
jgi:hypothetical protein